MNRAVTGKDVPIASVWQRTRWHASPGLACTIMVLLAVSFAVVYPLVPYSDRLTDQGKIVSYHPLAFIGFVAGMGCFAASYTRMLLIARKKRFADLRLPIALTTTGLLVAFAVMYPTNAIDVFIYAVRSHLLTTFGENPNGTMPLQYWEIAPFVRFSSKQWADDVSPYGPLWNLIAAPVTAFDGDRILVAVLGFKVINIAALIATGGFIHRAMLVRAPELALSATLLWLWNPLVLWEGVGNAHNDVIMMLPIAAALWAWETGRSRWVLPLIVASALIKYVAIVIAPVALVACLRRETTARGRILLLGNALLWTLVLWDISLYPFFDVAALWEGVQDQGARFAGSIGYVLLRGGRRLNLGDDLSGLVQGIGYALTVGAMVIGALACWIDPRRLPRVAFEVMTVFLLFGTMNFRAWYVIWIVALAAFTVSRGVWIRTIVWSVTAVLSYGHYIWIRQYWPFDRFWFEVTGVVIAIGPVLVLSLRGAWIWHQQRLGGTNQPRAAPARSTG
jgi:hypothetical protein